ncbi:MAG: ATP-binding protein [SAR324 cluster bacterium]|nr:ATP-binding protein [SAR324 cluster bacterium]
MNKTNDFQQRINEESSLNDYVDLRGIKFQPVNQSQLLIISSQLQNISKILEHLDQHCGEYCLKHGIDPDKVHLCLNEALTNAVVHGNFEIASALKETDWSVFYSKLRSCENDPIYSRKKVHILYLMTDDQLRFDIEDEGNGFDFKILQQLEQLDFNGSTVGRGLLIIRKLSSGAFWNKTGNRITIIFRSQKESCKNQKQNCWEFFKCGRELDGYRVHHGECPASALYHADGCNHGTNGGRVCWAINGTFCGKKNHGHAKHENGCEQCDFYKLVNQEESEHFDPGVQISDFTNRS